jgi:hypothetical protein
MFYGVVSRLLVLVGGEYGCLEDVVLSTAFTTSDVHVSNDLSIAHCGDLKSLGWVL